MELPVHVKLYLVGPLFALPLIASAQVYADSLFIENHYIPNDVDLFVEAWRFFEKAIH